MKTPKNKYKIRHEPTIDNVIRIWSEFEGDDRRFSGPRGFYDKSQYRIVSYDEDRPIGYLEAMVSPDGKRAEVNVGVSPSYQGKGVGTSLMKLAVAELRRAGVERLLYAIDRENRKFLALISRMPGAVEVLDPAVLSTYRFYNPKTKMYFEIHLDSKTGSKFNVGDLKPFHLAVSAIVRKGDKYLMLDHVKFGFWTIPIGKVDEGQTPLQAITAELEEETGISVIEAREIDVFTREYERDGKKVKVENHMFEIVRYVGIPWNTEPMKHRSMRWMSKKDILDGRALSDATKEYFKLEKSPDETIEKTRTAINEAASVSKLAEAKRLILEVMGILDRTGANRGYYEKMFKSMDSAKLERYLRSVAFSEDEFFILEVLPWKNEPTMRDAKEALKVLGVPMEEYVYLRHIVDGKEVRTRTRVPVGYLHVKRLQQFLAKKNSYNLDISQRSQKTGQLTMSAKRASITDSENYALTILGAEQALREFFGPRASDFERKSQMLQKITQEGYVRLGDLSSDAEANQILNTVDAHFLGCGIVTDLVTKGLALARTLKKKKSKESLSDKLSGS